MADDAAFPPSGAPDDAAWNVLDMAHMSQPIDLSAPYSTSTLAGKTILITGGASGFGAAFARHWAAHGAHIIIGDVSDAAGEALVADLRALPRSSPHHHYQHCDVTVWADQLSLFRFAASATPTRRIDFVVAGAGIVDMANTFDLPVADFSRDDAPPPPPDLKVMNVNMTGVMYTTHLALFWLRRNGRREDETPRDRHLLLISSIAGVAPLPGQTEYTASKHAVMGLFRALRGTSWRHGVRVNVICPYFVETALLGWKGMGMVAGAEVGRVEDVVEAATRLAADEGVVGRGLVVGPRGVVGGEEGKGRQAVWEVYAHDYQRVEVFVWRYLAMLNALKRVRGWVGVVKDFWRLYVNNKGKGKGGKKRGGK
ncbi:hypothetical protein B0T18DRAFT_322818 [Schizothecium vesticola]|uniref:NAD(P)-binding protein n=1 Tax=Schizothecium vesticola TaxID=314040 RepID=A0AA40F1D4_9PEZI|nr:hypothetical protein B0T18DRAFT_322818 [Schizothecium vesticola]